MKIILVAATLALTLGPLALVALGAHTLLQALDAIEHPE